MFQDNLQAGKFLEVFSGGGPEFTRAVKLVEEESRIEKLAQQKPRKFEDSEKSQKRIKPMIVSDKKDAKNEMKSKKKQKRSEESIQETVQSVNEKTRMENFRKLSQKKKSPKSPNPY